MEVITENPIIYIGANDTYEADIFLSLDGKSNSVEIKAFQDFANSMYNTKLKPDGKWGTNTAKAFDKYEKEWDEYYYGTSKTGRSVGDMIKNGGMPKVEPVNIRAKEPSATEKENAKKKGLTWDNVNKVYVKAQELGILDAILGKLGITPRTTTPPVGLDAPYGSSGGSPTEESKGMSTTTKILIGVGALAVVGLIVYSSRNTTKGK